MAELELGLRTSPCSQGDPLDHTASPQVRGGDGKARGEAQVKGSGTLRVRAGHRGSDIHLLAFLSLHGLCLPSRRSALSHSPEREGSESVQVTSDSGQVGQVMARGWGIHPPSVLSPGKAS